MNPEFNERADPKYLCVHIPSARFAPGTETVVNDFVAQASVDDARVGAEGAAERQSHCIEVDLGPSFSRVYPQGAEFKRVFISFISLDNRRVVLSGSVEGAPEDYVEGCDFAFIADPYQEVQPVDVLAGEPGTLGFLADLLAEEL